MPYLMFCEKVAHVGGATRQSPFGGLVEPSSGF